MLRFLKKGFKRSKKPSPPENPPRQATDTSAGCGRNPEDNNHGGGSQIANRDRRIGDQQLPTPNASTLAPGRGGYDATPQGHGSCPETRSEQLCPNTSDLHSARRNSNWKEHEGRELSVQQPSEIAPERTFGDGQDGGDAHDIDQVRSEGCGATERSRIGRAVDRFFTVVDLAKGPAEAFGPLKIVLESISVAYAIHQNTVAVKDKINVFRSRVAMLEKLFEKSASDKQEKRRREKLLIKFKEIGEQVRSLDGKSTVLRYLDNAQDSEDVNGLLEDLQEVVNDYLMAQQIAIFDQGCQLMDVAEMAVLNNFRSAKGAEYRHGGRKGCLKGTRGAVLNGIELWATEFGRSPVYWLNGLAGTGKSTIAKTIADRLFAGGQLGASFFCSRDFEDRSNLTLIFPTLATQLARKYEEFRSILVPLIQRDPEIASESLFNQMDKLIVQPLSETDISTVIVIDALDECKDEESASAILSVLGRLAPKIPKVKFFLTGRPEPRISKGFRLPLLAKITDRFVLHEVESDQVDSDIRLFFKNGFSEFARDLDGLDDWPTEKDLDRLCEQAAGLFVYAQATVKFVGNDKWDPRERLSNLLRSQKIGGHEGKTLDSLYTSILQGAFGDDDAEDQAKIRSVLGTIVLAVNPLSPSAIATLLRVDAKNVHRLLSSVNSLLILHENVDHPVRPFHKSFPDFVTDPTRCTDERFHISPPDHHLQLLIGCLDLMNQTLGKNMCKLPDGVANSDVSDLKERIEKYTDPFLRYACMSWHIHLVDVSTTPAHAPTIAPTLHRLLETRFLFWLEVLSVLGAARNALEALQVAAEWLEESPTLDLVNDCFRFVTGYFEIIDASSQHIYHSALVVAPETSIVRKLYGSYAHPFTRIVRGATMSWDKNTATTIRPSGISLAVWSPCDRFIAIVWSGWTRIDVLDSATLQRLQTHQPALTLATVHETIVFSPDSRILSISRYLDQWLHVDSWDLQTGGIASAIKWEGQGLSVVGNPSIAYSTNGKMVGVLCRYDDDANTANTANTADIFIFDVATGTHIHSHSLNSGIPLSNDIWAHGESLRFATVDAKSITIWEVGFSSGTTPTEVETLPSPDDFDPTVPPEGGNRTARVRLLSASCRLALNFRDKVLVWDIRNSKCLLDFTDTRLYPKMTFSSDGRFFACSTTESETYLWKESPAGYILHEILASSGPRSNPLLSPNGESIAVSNSSTIRLWRTTSFTVPPSNTLTRAPQHTGNFLLDFSPDGTLVVVSTGDSVVTVLNLMSGVPQLTIDTGMVVYYLRVIGNTVVVIGTQEVIAWDLPTGDCVPDATMSLEDSAWRTDLSGQQLDQVLTATISSDFRYIAFATSNYPDDFDHHLSIYSASTGECLGHGNTEGSTLWFFPNGCDVWCSSGREAEVWRVDDERKVLELQGTVDVEHPPEGYPWTSSRGYRVTDDRWILDPDGKRLLMLPAPWQSDELNRVWKGKLLTLLHGGLSEPIILDVEP